MESDKADKPSKKLRGVNSMVEFVTFNHDTRV